MLNDLITSPLFVWAILFSVAGFSFWASTETAIGRRISGVAIAIFISVALGNIGALPKESSAYDAVFGLVLPTAIALLLLQADLKRMIKIGLPLLSAYGVAVIATLVGAFLGVAFIDLGDAEPALAGMFVATYTGGSVNFFAVAETASFTGSPILPAAIAADQIATNFYLIGAMTLPGIAWVQRIWPTATSGATTETEANAAIVPGEETTERAEFDPASICIGLAAAAAIAAAGQAIATYLSAPSYAILIISIIALAVANLIPNLIAKLKGQEELGLVMLFVFLSAIGAGADLAAMTGAAAPVTAFAVVILVVHVIVVLAVGRLFGLGLPEILIASNAAVGGSSSAGPIAAALGWRYLVTPGILLGAFGNAIATFLGIAVFTLLR
ncbi:MAG: DUF819 family protein [Pseudomonadota bacterium]